MNIIEKIELELKAFEKKREDLLNTLRIEFPEILKPLFLELSEITSVSWCQYTPYFNDGEECTFHVYFDYCMEFNEIDEDDIEDKEFLKSCNKFREVLQKIPNDFYKDLFGDHVRVTIKNTGEITTSRYRHD